MQDDFEDVAEQDEAHRGHLHCKADSRVDVGEARTWQRVVIVVLQIVGAVFCYHWGLLQESDDLLRLVCVYLGRRVERVRQETQPGLNLPDSRFWKSLVFEFEVTPRRPLEGHDREWDNHQGYSQPPSVSVKLIGLWSDFFPAQGFSVVVCVF